MLLLRSNIDDLMSLVGVTKLQPPQELAVKAGLISGERPNLVIASPTGSGKTLIAEIAMLYEIQSYGKKAVYLVPLRALASEKGRVFRKYGDKLGLKIAVRTGDYDSDEIELKDQNIIIATYEKWDSIIRHKPKWLSEVGIVVADEGHQITDGERGPTIEIMLTRMRLAKVRILLLSAVMPNVESIARWLSGKAVKSNWRSTKLDIGFFTLDIIHGECCNNSNLPYLSWNCKRKDCRPDKAGFLKFIGDAKSKSKRLVDVDDPVSSLVYDALKSGGQIIVFLFQRRKNTQSSARKLCYLTSNFLTLADRRTLRELRSRLKSKASSDEESDTETSNDLDYCLSSGVSFHHAGMSESLRDIVEDGFRKSAIKIIVCTPTLAAGVNLPARRVIIPSIERYDAKAGNNSDISHWEFLNLAGRSGRPDYDTFGEAIAICKPTTDPNHVEEYVSAGPEEIISRLTGVSLYSHVLSEICLSNPTSEDDLTKFLMQTFAAQNQGQREIILKDLPKIIEFLTVNHLAFLSKDGKLNPTVLGERVSRLYINPFSVPILIEGLSCKSPKPSTRGLLHLVCSTYEWTPIIKNGDVPITIDEGSILLEEEESEKALRNASFLHQYIEELDAEKLYEQFNVGEADLHNAKDRGEWILYSAREIARIIGLDRSILLEIDKLRRRLKKGVKEELLDLTTIKGIARVRARRLFNAGIKTKEAYVKTDPEIVRQIIFVKRELKQKGGLESFF